MGWQMLLVISPRPCSSSSSPRTVPWCLCVSQLVVLGCTGVTCAAAVAYRGIASVGALWGGS